MKKFLLFATGTLLMLPLIASCGGGPSGNPQKDAEDFKDLYEYIEEIKLKIEEKKLEVHQFYADKKDSWTKLPSTFPLISKKTTKTSLTK